MSGSVRSLNRERDCNVTGCDTMRGGCARTHLNRSVMFCRAPWETERRPNGADASDGSIDDGAGEGMRKDRGGEFFRLRETCATVNE
jgi:hypothetical protein